MAGTDGIWDWRKKLLATILLESMPARSFRWIKGEAEGPFENMSSFSKGLLSKLLLLEERRSESLEISVLDGNLLFVFMKSMIGLSVICGYFLDAISVYRRTSGPIGRPFSVAYPAPISARSRMSFILPSWTGLSPSSLRTCPPASLRGDCSESRIIFTPSTLTGFKGSKPYAIP